MRLGKEWQGKAWRGMAGLFYSRHGTARRGEVWSGTAGLFYSRQGTARRGQSGLGWAGHGMARLFFLFKAWFGRARLGGARLG